MYASLPAIQLFVFVIVFSCVSVLVSTCIYFSECPSVCEDEEYDGIAADIDAEVHNTFFKVCRYLEKNYRKDILEIETC